MKEHSNIPYLIGCVVILIAIIFTYSLSINRYFRKQSYYVIEECSKYSAQAVSTTVNYALNNIQLSSVLASEQITKEQLAVHHSTADTTQKNSPFNEINFYHKNDLCALDFHETQIYKNAIDGNSGFEVVFKNDSNDETSLTFYSPVMIEGASRGVITGNLSISNDIAPLLSASFFNQKMLNILIDRDYRVLYSNSPDIPIGISLAYYEHDDFVKKIIRMSELKDSSSFFFEKNNKKNIGSVSAVVNPDWYVIQIIPNSSFIAFLRTITNRTIILMIFITLTLVAYAAQVLLKNKNRFKLNEKSNLTLINALTSFFEDVYSVNMNTGFFRAYHLSNEIRKKYGSTFANYKYEESCEIYKQNEVYEKDRELFDSVSSIEKVKNILKDKKAYSFKYRVFRDNTIKYFECQLIKPFESNPEFIIAFKNIDERTKQLKYLISLSKIYNTMHLINLKENTCEELNSTIEVRKFVNQRTNAAEQMRAIMADCATDDCRESALEFSEMSTIAERMKNKQSISFNFTSKYSGSVQAIIIAIDTDSEGKPLNIVYATQLLEPNNN